jgi:hypothetical protein
MTTYLRPFSLVFGTDARRMIAAGDALSLGGMAHIGFTHVEVMSRRDALRVLPIDKVRPDQLAAITTPRPPFGGLGMDRAL